MVEKTLSSYTKHKCFSSSVLATSATTNSARLKDLNEDIHNQLKTRYSTYPSKLKSGPASLYWVGANLDIQLVRVVERIGRRVGSSVGRLHICGSFHISGGTC